MLSTNPKTSIVLPKPISSQRNPPLGSAGTRVWGRTSLKNGENKTGAPFAVTEGTSIHIKFRIPPGAASSSSIRAND